MSAKRVEALEAVQADLEYARSFYESWKPTMNLSLYFAVDLNSHVEGSSLDRAARGDCALSPRLRPGRRPQPW